MFHQNVSNVPNVTRLLARADIPDDGSEAKEDLQAFDF
jgi:hypothetical protein